jgi:ABC-type tungstate transport system substrate-binding protein
MARITGFHRACAAVGVSMLVTVVVAAPARAFEAAID